MKLESENSYTFGLTIYKPQKILLVNTQVNLIKTLKHELMHVWMYEYGHKQERENTYNHEDICELVASSNDFINEIVARYKKEVKRAKNGK